MSDCHDLPAEIIRIYHPALMQVPKVCYSQDLLFEAFSVLFSSAMTLLRTGKIEQSNTCLDTIMSLLHYDPLDFSSNAHALMAIGFTVSTPTPVFFLDCSLPKDDTGENAQ